MFSAGDAAVIIFACLLVLVHLAARNGQATIDRKAAEADALWERALETLRDQLNEGKHNVEVHMNVHGRGYSMSVDRKFVEVAREDLQ